MAGRNLLILLTDEHMRAAVGCYGHPIVRTPNLDRLAGRGVRFDNAYTPSPICVPARASLATGRYVHQSRCWSNAQPYHGQIDGWGHRLIAEGHRVVSVGKLHYRSDEDDNGFDEEILPLHVAGTIGWVRGLLRREPGVFDKCHEFAEQIGPGEADYSDYDRKVCAAACAWLRGEAPRLRDKPWVLFVSLVRPHYPLTCPKAYYDRYPPERMDPPRRGDLAAVAAHPVVAALRRYMNYDDFFDDRTRLIARASYYGLCSFIDDLAGQVLCALEDSGQDQETLVLYTSDHGELLGNHGLWTKCVMYEDAAAIPMLLSGPGIPQGKCVATPTSLVDVHQTVLEATGLGLAGEDRDLPGRSLLETLAAPDEARPVFSEYHDGGSITGMFMLRRGRWKYVHYPGYRPQLFDLEGDPHELNDLGESADHAGERRACEAALRKVVDPDRANDLAFADQAARIEELGGREGILATQDYDFTPVPE